MSSTSDAVIESGNSSSPSRRLKEARETLGITQKALADDLYLPRNYILWIEEGAFEKLPSMVFCRGYIRSYAKLVGENGEELIQLLDSVYGSQNEKAPLLPASKIDQQVKVGDPVMKWSSLLFILILCAAVFWWWKTQFGLSAPFFSSQDSIAVEIADGNELLLPSLNSHTAIETSNDQLVVHTPNSAQNLQLSTSVESQAVVINQASSINNGTGISLSLNLVDEEREAAQLEQLEKVVQELEPTALEVTSSLLVESVIDPELLQMVFNNECWITIKDANGKTIFNGIKKSGQELSLSAIAPLNVSIGRVDSVSNIIYGGQEINLSQLGKNNIANFNLPL